MFEIQVQYDKDTPFRVYLSTNIMQSALDDGLALSTQCYAVKVFDPIGRLIAFWENGVLQ